MGKTHNPELNILHCSTNIVRVIKWRRMRWARHAECIGEERLVRFWPGNLGKRNHWRDPGVDGRILLRLIFRKWGMGVWTGSNWLRIRTGGEHL